MSNPNITERIKKNMLTLVQEYWDLYQTPIPFSYLSIRFNASARSTSGETVMSIVEELSAELRVHKLLARDAAAFLIPIKYWVELTPEERVDMYASLPPSKKVGRRPKSAI